MRINFDNFWNVFFTIFIFPLFAAPVMAGLIAIGLSFIAFTWRVIYWLYSDHWVTSICDMIEYVIWSDDLHIGDDERFRWMQIACYHFDLNWRGLSRVLNWLYGLDISMLFLVISVFLFLLFFIMWKFLEFVVRLKEGV